MKQLLFSLILLIVAAGFAIPAEAQQTQRRSDRKEIRQRARIHEGRQSGELTRRESRQLRKQQRRIHMRKRKAAADGAISPQEQQTIDRSQRRANRNIYRKKHNNRNR